MYVCDVQELVALQVRNVYFKFMTACMRMCMRTCMYVCDVRELVALQVGVENMCLPR